MPPRKSNVSQISATEPEGGGTPVKERDGINIEDLSLPRTMVQRLAKGVLPPNTSLGKDAIVAMQKGATVFINYLAQSANTATTNANKRTIPPPAVLEALVDLEFEAFVPRVEAELQKYNEIQVGKRNEYRRKVKEEKLGGTGKEGDGEGDTTAMLGSAGEEEEGRERKRVRRDEGEGGEGDGHEQLLVGGGQDGEEEGDENLDETFDGDEDTVDRSQDLRPGKQEGGEDGEDQEEEEEEEEEEDDEDEYPDEGRRLSSVEREAHEGPRSPRYDDRDPMDEEEAEEDEEGLSDVSD